MDEQEDGPDIDALPFAAPARRLEPTAPLCWLRAGLEDMRRAPVLSLGYGAVMALLSALIALLSWRFGALGLYLGLATGFLFVGPVLALGLYSFSCQIEAGRRPVPGYCLREGGRHLKDLLIFSTVLLVIFLIWARAATMVHVFFPVQGDYSLRDLAGFLAIGSAVGAVFAAVVFTASAFSLPMIMDRRVDAITAVITSANAVLRNKAALLVWALIIFFCVLLGFATALFGFVFLLPLLGHATWHAYRDTIDASAWPAHEPLAGMPAADHQ
ncbi:integral membrane protein [Thiohalobacter thiocyanaticus]|uniref:Integral membrane protein n=1 Tax=Thiohalobacter thiocyanaticus TaxID=585455 RepID=A0A1Z4VMV0_9GAMM|nr:DUF2189 domain-containing protein [Thiohalobacter thiocyanaticus]BAZ92825.1 integral membrane protein [Thiohalobacter thiocyanaticus]